MIDFEYFTMPLHTRQFTSAEIAALADRYASEAATPREALERLTSDLAGLTSDLDSLCTDYMCDNYDPNLSRQRGLTPGQRRLALQLMATISHNAALIAAEAMNRPADRPGGYDPFYRIS